MKINSLNDAMEFLHEQSPTEESSNIDAVLDHSSDYVTDTELANYLSGLIEEIGFTKSEVMLKAGLDEGLGFQIFSGITTPTFNTLFRICLAATFTLAETQKAIELAGFTPLDDNNPRDSVLIRALLYMKSINDINNELYSLNQSLL